MVKRLKGNPNLPFPFHLLTLYPFEFPYTDSLFSLFAANLSSQARLAEKHSPQSTGLPAEGLKGTLSVLPHWSQVIS